jgi:hypothetical protein
MVLTLKWSLISAMGVSYTVPTYFAIPEFAMTTSSEEMPWLVCRNLTVVAASLSERLSILTTMSMLPSPDREILEVIGAICWASGDGNDGDVGV